MRCDWLMIAANGWLAALALTLGLHTNVLAQTCVGDCDGDGRVVASEIIAVLRGECTAVLPGEVGTQVAAAINGVFSGCAEPPADWQVSLDASAIGWMMSGWGPGDGAIWVVGGTAFEGKILRFELGEWRQVELDFSVPLLNWVHGTSASDVFAGSNDGDILHFDGGAWSLQETPVDDPVWGVWAVAPDDVWAVGGDSVLGTEPFVIHYDGVRWSPVPLPQLQRPGVAALFKVWGSASDDVYAVGQNGAVVHWDGANLTEMGVGISQDLIGIWGNGRDDVSVVGGRGTAEIAHFNGVEWIRSPPSRIPGLNGVWTRRDDLVHAVGVAATVLKVDPRTRTVLEEIPVPTDLELHAVFGDASGRMFIFGANFIFPESGVVLTRKLVDED